MIWSSSGERSVMKSCSPALCVLILLTITVITGSESSAPVVTVSFNGSATLPCSERCSGLVRWTVFSKPKDTLAECDQTSCRSVKEGYQMIHHQYLNGSFSLIITDADFSKRGWYTCDCDGKDLCDVVLKLKNLEYSKKMNPGETLILDLPVSEPVKVTFTRTGDGNLNPVKLCEVEGRIIQCDPPYEKRVVFQSSLQLKDLKDSDGGVYTLIDTKNQEIVSTYKVSIVRAVEPSETWSRSWIWICTAFFGAGLVVGLVLGYLDAPPIVKCCQWLKRRKYCTCVDNHHTEETTRSSTPEHVPCKRSPQVNVRKCRL